VIKNELRWNSWSAESITVFVHYYYYYYYDILFDNFKFTPSLAHRLCSSADYTYCRWSCLSGFCPQLFSRNVVASVDNFKRSSVLNVCPRHAFLCLQRSFPVFSKNFVVVRLSIDDMISFAAKDNKLFLCPAIYNDYCCYFYYRLLLFHRLAFSYCCVMQSPVLVKRILCTSIYSRQKHGIRTKYTAFNQRLDKKMITRHNNNEVWQQKFGKLVSDEECFRCVIQEVKWRH